MKKTLVKIPLQFFGDSEDDFEDNFEDEEDDEENEDEDLGGGDDAEAAEDADPEEEGKDSEDDKGSEEKKEEGKGDKALIEELRALGYVGDDLASLASDMKAKREAKEQRDKSKARKADLEAGKAHVKGSRPGKSAIGGGASGYTERQVNDLVGRTGCSKDRARELLAKHQRLINGG